MTSGRHGKIGRLFTANRGPISRGGIASSNAFHGTKSMINGPHALTIVRACGPFLLGGVMTLSRGGREVNLVDQTNLNIGVSRQ